MRSPVFWRRSSTAAGVYLSAVLGFLGSVVAVRELGIYDFGLLSLVLAASGFFQIVADVTVEEAVVKYGFRYAAREDWGRFRRLFRAGLELKLAGAVLGAAAIALLAPFAHAIWGRGLALPLLISALIPLAQAPEGIASAALIVHGRYDVRAAFLVLTMALRLGAIAIGATFGVTGTVIALVVARIVATAAIGGVGIVALGRFPRGRSAPLGDDRAGFRRFVVHSSLGSVLSPMRGLLGTLVVGAVTDPQQVAYFRVAQAPEAASASLTAPARLILFAETLRGSSCSSRRFRSSGDGRSRSPSRSAGPSCACSRRAPRSSSSRPPSSSSPPPTGQPAPPRRLRSQPPPSRRCGPCSRYA